MTDLKMIYNLLKAYVERTEADACVECKYLSVEDWEMPCKECRRAKKDYWRRRDG